MTRRRAAFPALPAFVVASDATLVAALLRQIAGTLSASPAAAGQAVTVYAGVAIGGAIGGLTLTLSRSAAAVCWTAAGIELAALTLVGRAASRQNPRPAAKRRGELGRQPD